MSVFISLNEDGEIADWTTCTESGFMGPSEEELRAIEELFIEHKVAHAEVEKRYEAHFSLMQETRDKVHKVAENILSICEVPLYFEKILQEVFKGYGLSMNFEQYVLVGSTVRSYLSWLKDNGNPAATFQDSMLLWQRV